MISHQRSFQAGSRVITTSDMIISEAVTKMLTHINLNLIKNVRSPTEELPEDSNTSSEKSGYQLMPALIAIVLLRTTVGAMYFMIKLNKPEETTKPQITEGGQPLDMEPSGEEKYMNWIN